MSRKRLINTGVGNISLFGVGGRRGRPGLFSGGLNDLMSPSIVERKENEWQIKFRIPRYSKRPTISARLAKDGRTLMLRSEERGAGGSFALMERHILLPGSLHIPKDAVLEGELRGDGFADLCIPESMIETKSEDEPPVTPLPVNWRTPSDGRKDTNQDRSAT